MNIANRHDLIVVEDAAQSIDSFYKGRPLGSIGHMAAFSFHETKNIISGEGGLLAINDERFIPRAEILWEKGTNRAQFFRGEINKYGWVDTGSSFLPSELVAAFLWAQLEDMDDIQNKRKALWQRYYEKLKNLGRQRLVLPAIPDYATNNAHMFYLVCNSLDERSQLIAYLKRHGILAVFHYLALHKSNFYTERVADTPNLPNCDRYADCLVRLPMYYDLKLEQVDEVCRNIEDFIQKL